MKKLVLGMVVALSAGCSGSNARAPKGVYEARDKVDQVGASAKSKIRPAVRPVVATVDRGVESAVTSVGLREESSKKN